MEINFCRRCAATVKKRAEGFYVCANNHELYYKPYPAASIALLNGNGELLVGIRGRDPDKGAYDLPGGFCEADETYEQAALREFKEETGVHLGDVAELKFLCDSVGYYDYEGEIQQVLDVIFVAHLRNTPKLIASDDIADLMWLPLPDIDVEKFSPGFVNARKAVALLKKSPVIGH